MPELIPEDQTEGQISQYIHSHNKNIHKHKQIQNPFDIQRIKIHNQFCVQIDIENDRKHKKLKEFEFRH
jgi:hypothetical protein